MNKHTSKFPDLSTQSDSFDTKCTKAEDDEHVIVIFDWDDTLFCTKYLDMHNLDYSSLFSAEKSIEEVGSYLGNELQSLESLMEMEVNLFIVTNADEKWIENCLHHFMPDLKDFIEENSIKVYSAKKLFSKNSPLERWKAKCFKKVILENFSRKNSRLRILSIGDSFEEKLAALALNGLKYYSQINVKFLETLKFPTISTLIFQFNFILDNFDELLQSQQFLHQIQIEKVVGGLRSLPKGLAPISQENDIKRLENQLLNRKTTKTHFEVATAVWDN